MNKASTQSTRMNLRGVLFLLYLLTAVIFSAVLGFAIFRIAYPQPKWIELGNLSDFPPSDQPYVIDRDVYVFLVNDGESIIVLNPLNSSRGGMIVNWDSKKGVFRDPNRGSEFNLQGMPTIDLEDHSLARYNSKIENGVVYIDLSESRKVRLDRQE